jgi:16S rRNA (uracil1498-N3)-methyltransferase
MRIPRVFYPYDLIAGDEIILDVNNSRHILKVLRLSIGMTLNIFNGNGSEYIATILATNNQRVTAKIGQLMVKEVESPLKIHLAQGVSRGEKMDYVIQKAVELGVHKITPLFTEYCNVKLIGERISNRVSRWESIIISACEQSGRSYVPRIEAPQKLSTWFTKLRNDIITKILLDPHATATIREVKMEHPEVTVLIGPEGGLSEDEVLLAQSCGFVAVRLGPRILRTETAALAALSALQTQFGDFLCK